jgi:hypothetical protein
MTRHPFYRKLGGLQGWSERVRKISPPPIFDPRTVQPLYNKDNNRQLQQQQHNVAIHAHTQENNVCGNPVRESDASVGRG